MTKKILHLTIKKKWFDKIAKGTKKKEYREEKPYWDKRLLDGEGFYKQFDEVHFRNGYGKDFPFMRVKCKSIELDYRDEPEGRKWYHIISLGKVLEVKKNAETK